MKVTTEDTKKLITKTKIPRRIIIKSLIKTLRVSFDGALTLMEKIWMTRGFKYNNQAIIKAMHD